MSTWLALMIVAAFPSHMMQLSLLASHKKSHWGSQQRKLEVGPVNFSPGISHFVLQYLFSRPYTPDPCTFAALQHLLPSLHALVQCQSTPTHFGVLIHPLTTQDLQLPASFPTDFAYSQQEFAIHNHMRFLLNDS